MEVTEDGHAGTAKFLKSRGYDPPTFKFGAQDVDVIMKDVVSPEDLEAYSNDEEQLN